MGEIASYRFDNNELFIENPSLFQKYLGKESPAPIELLTKSQLKFRQDMVTISLSSKSSGGKMSFSYVFSKQ